MPEEINRLVTDRLANLLLTPSREAGDELRREGEPESEIVFVGNVMIDSLLAARDKAMALDTLERLAITPETVVVTLHRPSNVDDGPRLQRIAEALSDIATERPVLFPAHPRTRARLQSFGVQMPGVRVIEPLRYLEMVAVTQGAFAVVTDSGGVQEESTALGVPCFTIRPNTERPVTVTHGTNTLVPDPDGLAALVRSARRPASPRIPEGWDGRAAIRVVTALVDKS
jgi:UDP-N-acetylglucosamine 2-epimerase (non-hydrolysing)